MKKTELTIPAEINSIIAIRNLIEKIGFRYAFTSNTIHATKLAVEEAVTNIIRHGYLNTTDKKITIQIQARLYSLGIVVIDQGSSFDPKQVNNPDIVKYIDIRKKGGLGIFMIRKLMDEFNYQVTDRGNEIHLLKYRDGCHRSNLRNFVHLLKTPSKLKIFLPMYLDCTRNMQ